MVHSNCALIICLFKFESHVVFPVIKAVVLAKRKYTVSTTAALKEHIILIKHFSAFSISAIWFFIDTCWHAGT